MTGRWTPWPSWSATAPTPAPAASAPASTGARRGRRTPEQSAGPAGAGRRVPGPPSAALAWAPGGRRDGAPGRHGKAVRNPRSRSPDMRTRATAAVAGPGGPPSSAAAGGVAGARGRGRRHRRGVDDGLQGQPRPAHRHHALTTAPCPTSGPSKEVSGPRHPGGGRTCRRTLIQPACAGSWATPEVRTPCHSSWKDCAAWSIGATTRRGWRCWWSRARDPGPRKSPRECPDWRRRGRQWGGFGGTALLERGAPQARRLERARPQAKVVLRRAPGKLDRLIGAIDAEASAADGAGALRGRVAIGHTRWATHGSPTERNAHPHADCRGETVVAHNGIVENYEPLRAELQQEGHHFASETDSEVIAHLIEREVSRGASLVEATRRALLSRSAGPTRSRWCTPPGRTCSWPGAPGTPGASSSAQGEGEMYVASDLPAILERTRSVTFLESGELAAVDASGVSISRLDGTPVQRPFQTVPYDPLAAARGGYRHFMLKEIHEQPRALLDTMQGRLLRPRPLGAPRRRAPRPGRRQAAEEGRPGRLRHRLARRAGREVPGGGAGRHSGGGRLRLGVPLPPAPARRRHAGGGHLPVRRDGGHAGVHGGRSGGRGQRAGHRQRRGQPGGADGDGLRRRALHPGRAGDRGRLHQGLHLPAGGPGPPRPLPGRRPQAPSQTTRHLPSSGPWKRSPTRPQPSSVTPPPRSRPTSPDTAPPPSPPATRPWRRSTTGRRTSSISGAGCSTPSPSRAP